MHPRNPYCEPPDFLALANAYPPLKPHLILKPNGPTAIDFKNDASQRRLTQALLYRDFGITLTLPDNRLCPPVPNRLNYVLWIQDIVSQAPTQEKKIVWGMDIGTGASAIYPLLACKMEPTWQFVATDIDEASLRTAHMNISSNNLQDRITILPTIRENPLLFPLSVNSATTFDFAMCNPPFYDSVEEVAQSAEAKEWGPNAVCTGADIEMIAPGGETAFVGRMVEESRNYGVRCRWYTSMLGKLSSLSNIVALLRHYSIENFAITELVQGYTRRWAIGWSFTDIHVPDAVARISNPSIQNLMPPRNSLNKPIPLAQSQQHLVDALLAVLDSVDDISREVVTTKEPPYGSSSVLVHAKGNTWSRAARRKNKGTSTAVPLCSRPSTSRDAALTCRVNCTEAHGPGESLGLELQWIRGRDRLLFESFYGHITRKVESWLEAKLDMSDT